MGPVEHTRPFHRSRREAPSNRRPGWGRRSTCLGVPCFRPHDSSCFDLERRAVCHLDNLQGDSVSPSLVGSTFLARFAGSSAHEMVQALRSTMPQNAPDSLGDRAYIDLVSFLLKANGSRAGSLELPLDVAELERIVITDQPAK